MDEKEKELSEEEFMEVVGGSSPESTTDLLTDPSDVAASAETDRAEGQVGIGHRLRAMRKKKGFTTAELSEATGIETKLIEEVEAGNAVLPFGSLVQVGAALSLRIRDVIGAGKAPFTVVRKKERTPSRRYGSKKKDSHGYAYESLAANKKNRKMEPFVVTLSSSSELESSDHGGQEFIYVLEGSVTLHLGDENFILAPGDSAYYEANTPHCLCAHQGNSAKILAVLTD